MPTLKSESLPSFSLTTHNPHIFYQHLASDNGKQISVINQEGNASAGFNRDSFPERCFTVGLPSFTRISFQADRRTSIARPFHI
jgi:hypothetical protein